MMFLYLIFLAFASAFGGISITLTEVDPEINLPTTEISFGEHKWLGGGASGNIVLVKYVVEDKTLDLVLKLVSKNKSDEIKNEFKILQELKGKADHLDQGAIIRAYGYGTYSGDDEGDVLVLQYFCSANLHVLGFDFTATTLDVLSAGLDLINLLEVTHNEGILHLDIKSSNLLYAMENKKLAVVLVDWGTAEHFYTAHKTGKRGTIPFMSPDVARGLAVHGPDDDLRSVMYTLGKAGIKGIFSQGYLPWEITYFRALALTHVFQDMNQKKEEFENKLELQGLHPQLLNALVAIREYLKSPSPRIPGQINYGNIRKAFLDAIEVEKKVPQAKTWMSSFKDLFTRLANSGKND